MELTYFVWNVSTYLNFVFQLGLHQSATDSFQITVRLIRNDELAYLNA